MITDDRTAIVNQKNLISLQCAFICTTRRDRQAQGLALDHLTQISAGSEYPAAKVEIGSSYNQTRSNLCKIVRHAICGNIIMTVLEEYLVALSLSLWEREQRYFAIRVVALGQVKRAVPGTIG